MKLDKSFNLLSQMIEKSQLEDADNEEFKELPVKCESWMTFHLKRLEELITEESNEQS